MNISSLLKDKRAIVFGAGGSIGAAVAEEFAAEGAEVFLAGRTKTNGGDYALALAVVAGAVAIAMIVVIRFSPERGQLLTAH